MRKMSLFLALVLLLTSVTGCGQLGSKAQTYTITWVNYDGTVLEVDEKVPAGTVPEYNGETPVWPADEDFEHQFFGWFSAVMPAEADATYTAQYYFAEKSHLQPGMLGAEEWSIFDFGIGIIHNYIKNGEFVAPLIDKVIKCFFKQSGEEGYTLSDVQKALTDLQNSTAQQYEDLKKEIAALSQEQRAIAAAIEAEIERQSVISNAGITLDSLATSLEITQDSIAGINAQKISEDVKKTLDDPQKALENAKALQIAAIIKNYTKWGDKDNLFYQCISCVNAITNTSYGATSGKDLLTNVYEQYASESMFTGEAKYYAELYAEKVTMLALYAYSICAECLKAHQIVSAFDENDKADLIKIDPTFAALIDCTKTNVNIVTTQSNSLNSKLFKKDSGSFADVMKAFYQDGLNRHIYINKGNANLALNDELLVQPYENSEFVNTGKTYNEWSYWYLNEKLDKISEFNSEIRAAIVAHAAENFPGTMREYLTALGYDLSAVPENAWFYINYNCRNGDTIYSDGRWNYAYWFEQGGTGVNIDDETYTVNELIVIRKDPIKSGSIPSTVVINQEYFSGCFVTLWPTKVPEMPKKEN